LALLTLLMGFSVFQWNRNMKSSREAADWPVMIANGRFEQAERQIDLSLRRYGDNVRVKLLGLHNLAMLRHAQQRWDEAVVLCRAVLDQQLALARALAKPSRLLLADSLLQVGDMNSAFEALSRLYDQRLSLAEAMTLLQLQLDYSWRVGAYDSMLSGLPVKVQLAELMPSASAARTQAFLGLAAHRLGREDLAGWLAQRVKLLVDPAHFVGEMPAIAELWKQTPPMDHPSPTSAPDDASNNVGGTPGPRVL
jgi:hypothetical protein